MTSKAVLENLARKLHPYERALVPVLQATNDFDELCKQTGLQSIEVMRGLQWLANKEVLTLESNTHKVILLGKNGLKYKKEGLPELRLLAALTNNFQDSAALAKKTKLETQEISASVGQLKRQSLIEISKSAKGLELKKSQLAMQLGKAVESQEQDLLAETFPLEYQAAVDLGYEKTIAALRKRKEFINIEVQKQINITVKNLGKELAKLDLSIPLINRFGSKELKSGEWKEKEFRAYDVEINVPQINSGKVHFVNQAVEYIRNIWLEMGFEELDGEYVHSAFWNLDALFIPQDHPAREMQDTYYLAGNAKLDPKQLKAVRAAHEVGAETGSKGWGYKFSKQEAEKVLLRTHTTVLSALKIADLSPEDLPKKYFSVEKVFRNEALDWKHLFEFYQVEGIVVDPNANLSHLKGYLTQFYKKMGFEKIRMRPAHFPYTEPSLEIDVFHPVKKQWVELGGAGIFRPEVVKPLLGIDCPVLAWGQGMGRIISEYWKITDIRDLYKNDLKQLRDMKAWMK